jgi:hypothetical protein
MGSAQWMRTQRVYALLLAVWALAPVVLLVGTGANAETAPELAVRHRSSGFQPPVFSRSQQWRLEATTTASFGNRPTFRPSFVGELLDLLSRREVVHGTK